MFPIVSHINSLANSIHVIKGEINDLRNSVAASTRAPAPIQQVALPPVIPQAVIDDIKSVANQTTQGVNEVRRYVDTVKSEIMREISMLESMIIRKCEITLNKMINDKVNIALDSQRSSGRDNVSSVVGSLREEIHAEIAKVSGVNATLSATVSKLQAQVVQLKHELEEERQAATTALMDASPSPSPSHPQQPPSTVTSLSRAIESRVHVHDDHDDDDDAFTFSKPPPSPSPDAMDEDALDEIERMISPQPGHNHVSSTASADRQVGPSKSASKPSVKAASAVGAHASKINKKSTGSTSKSATKIKSMP